MTTFEAISAIKARMQETGCSQRMLSKLCGYTEVTLGRWLNYKRNVPGYAMFDMLHTLGLDMQIVYRNEDEEE